MMGTDTVRGTASSTAEARPLPSASRALTERFASGTAAAA